MSEKNPATEAPQASGQFGLQRVYLKDLSFEAPATPAVFAREWKPQANIQMNTSAKKQGEDSYEVVLTVTVTVKNEEETVYLVEVQQAGLFLVKGIEESALERLLGAHCPNLLFPYAHAQINDVVIRGSFPQVPMAPVNFEALLMEAKKQQIEKAQQPDNTTH